MELYNDILVESGSDYLLEQEILEEGANIDLYKIFKDLKSNYSSKIREFDELMGEGKTKEAKAILENLLKDLQDARNRVKVVDDSSFSAKVGDYGFRVLKIIATFAVSLFFNSLTPKKVDGKILPKIKINIKNAIKPTIISSLFVISKQIVKLISTMENRKYKIEREIKNNNLSKEEATKKVGGLYKNEIIEYIDELSRDIRKIIGSLNQ